MRLVALALAAASLLATPGSARAQSAQASASGSASAGASDSGGICFGCDPYYYQTTWWWNVYASGGVGGALDGHHDALFFGRFGPAIGFGDGDWAWMLQLDYDVSAQSQAAFDSGLWAIYDGVLWVQAGGLVDLDAGHVHAGARLALGWTLFGVEAQARRYDPSTQLGDVFALYGTITVPYGLAQKLLYLPELPGGGTIYP